MTNSQPLVSVSCITYNHAKYIRAAIEGFLLQETTFPIEILIHDDASTDGTAEIVKEYERLYAERIMGIYQTENQFSKGVRISATYVWPRTKGNYLALCEGDDFWIDPRKLQKQVNFLEAHKEYVMCFHAVNVIGEISEGFSYSVPNKTDLTFRDLLMRHYIPTCSLVFRKDAMPNPLPSWYHRSRIGDIPLELMVADKGLTKYFPEVMATYRKHGGGITNDPRQKQLGRKTYLFVYSNLNRQLKYKYWHLFSYMILRTRLGYVKDFVNGFLRK
jgi:glycosyltransferase involved in cell wall biosynthesis